MSLVLDRHVGPFAAAAVGDAGRRVAGRLVRCDGAAIVATGCPWPLGTAACVTGSDGRAIALELTGFHGSEAWFVALDDCPRLAPGMAVWRSDDADAGMAVVGDALLGRVIDARGRPLDGAGPIAADRLWPIEGRAAAVLDRGRVLTPFDTGVRAVNALMTLGRGQRVALVAGSGVGKSVLMGQIIAGAGGTTASAASRIVVALVGERGREIADFLADRLPPAMRARAATIAVPADQPPLLRLRAVMRATAIAEAWRADGHDVLLLVDSLTRVAHAQREIGLAMGEPPTMKGYPPSALSLIPRLVERAGVDTASGGSITAIYTVLADGDDLNDPVVDTARAICDGHIILSRSLAEQGVFPAIDVARSLSRVMPDLVDARSLVDAQAFRRLWSLREASRDLVMMGAYQPGADAELDAALAMATAQRAFVCQPPDACCDLATALHGLADVSGTAP